MVKTSEALKIHLMQQKVSLSKTRTEVDLSTWVAHTSKKYDSSTDGHQMRFLEEYYPVFWMDTSYTDVLICFSDNEHTKQNCIDTASWKAKA